jgi:hypothetical protein
MKFKEFRSLTEKNKSKVEEGAPRLSAADYKKAQEIVNDPKTKGGNYTQAWKDLEKWKKGSTKDKKVNDMLFKAHEEVKEEKVECPKCEGTGEIAGKTCEHCEGKGYHMTESAIVEGTWSVPDSKKKLQAIQAILNKPITGLEKNARKLLVDLYSLFGDDGLYDDIEAFFDAPDKSKDLRNVIIYHLSDWGVEFKGYKLTKAPAAWADNSGPGHRIDTDEAKDQKIQRTPLGRKDITQEASVKRGRGNIKKPKGRSVIFSHHKDMKEIRKEGLDVQEKLTPKQMEKRLAMIKKAVEKINKKNADAAKKDALKMMKDSGMFDEGIDEGKYTKYSDLLVKKAKLVAQGPIASKEVAAVNKQIAAEMKKLGVKEDK